MTEGTPLSSPDHAVNMPAHVDHSHLVVTDLPQTAQWYQNVMGLSVLDSSASGQTLGVGGPPGAPPACFTMPSCCRAVRSCRAGWPMPLIAA